MGAERATLSSRAALASVGLATTLLLIKGYAAWKTDSTAMLGSLADTGLDLIASIFTLAGVRIAAIPADEDHRFGHGKAEALVAMAQVMLIAVSAVGIAWRAADRLVSGSATSDAELGIGVSLFAMALTVGLLAYQRRVIARTNSVAIKTDNVHYQSDLLLNAAVIAALWLEQFWHLAGADAWFGLAIAAFLVFGAWQSSSHALDQLMDREWPDEKRAQLIALIQSHPEMAGIHDLRTRTSGGHDFIQFQISLEPLLSVAKAHDVMDEIEATIRADFPGADILIHPVPFGHPAVKELTV
ncbi:cation diffusion facilitator family transporter [Sphingomonas ginkgonis]|uniref:Cation diffusion facilitator family transporter n=1 Tax=Sphingomonas ginkgonis TaxID=2315330 RepID=A0A3R9Y8E9_9SPHN|nr:cation diffusion facilitator family transporter [Sphingomonas ginkgonis]